MCDRKILTVVTATFNIIKAGRSDALKRCVASVADLKFSHEHLIIDGASSDGTKELIQSLQVQYPDLRIVSEPDTGVYDAFNKGARLATAEWIFYLGSDDFVFNPSAFERAVNAAMKFGAGFVISPVKVIWGMFRISRRTRLYDMPYSHQGILMSKDVIMKLGGFDTKFKICADRWLTFQAHLRGVPYRIFDEMYIYYSEGGVSQTVFQDGRVVGVEHSEYVNHVAEYFRLNEVQKDLYAHKGLLPMSKLLPFFFCRDVFLRTSAWWMVILHVLNVFGLVETNGRVKGRLFRNKIYALLRS